MEASLDPNLVEMLQTPFEEEIRRAVLECNGDKAIDPDGFTWKFFRRIGDC